MLPCFFQGLVICLVASMAISSQIRALQGVQGPGGERDRDRGEKKEVRLEGIFARAARPKVSYRVVLGSITSSTKPRRAAGKGLEKARSYSSARLACA